MRPNIGAAVCALALTAAAAQADLNNPDTDWMSARYGVGFHYLQNWLPETKDGGPAEWNATVDSFDVDGFASRVASTGAKWVLFTVGQNSGYYCAPCSVMNSYSGYAPGERCSRRDLPMDMADALASRGIRLVLYLPVNAPKDDARIANGFGLTVKDGNGNWHLTTAFVQKWTQVVKEWSDRYGTRISGWWFDGAYGANGWSSSMGPYYKNAAVSGNPDSIIALNGGAGSLSKRSDAQDYTAGEDGDLSTVCTSRWFSGLHCATFIPFGSWGGAGAVKWTDAQVIDYTNRQRGVGATVTWNLGVSGAGVVNPGYAAVFDRIKGSIGGGTSPTPTPTPTPTLPGGIVEVTPGASGVTASTTDGNLPGNTVDNSLSTRWSGSGDGAWIRYDLGVAQTVAFVRIAVYNGNARQNRFDLQLSSDAVTWTNAITGGLTSGTTTAEETHDFPDQPARFVRYVGHMSNVGTFNSLTEVSLFAASEGGTLTPTPTPTPTASPIPTATPTPGAFPGYYRLTARHSGKAVVVQAASTANLANVLQWTYGGTNTNDEWAFVPSGGGYYHIVARHSGKAMSVLNASTANGGDVVQWTVSSGANDEWQPVDLGNGAHRIVNRHSGKVLNVAGASTADGANVDQWSWANVNQQMFEIVSVP